MQQALIALSSVVIFAAYLIYEWSIIVGRTRPHRTTRFVLLIITALGFASLIAQHDRAAVWLIGICAVHSAIVFLMSLKYGMGGYEKIDLVCLAIAILGIAVWKLTDDPAIGLYASVAADFTSMIPALNKTYKQPHTEYWLSYIFDIVASLLTLAAVTDWQIQSTLYPLYIVLVNTIMLACISQPIKRRKLKTLEEPTVA